MAEALSRAQRRRLDRAQASADRVTDGDRRFFERFPARSHRVRLAAPAEVEQNAAIADLDTMPADPGHRWFTALKQLRPGIRLRAFVQLADGVDCDMDERQAAALFKIVAPPRSRIATIEWQIVEALAKREVGP